MKNELSKHLRDVKDQAVKEWLGLAVIIYDYNISKMAREFKTDRPNLSRLLKKHKIDVKTRKQLDAAFNSN